MVDIDNPVTFSVAASSASPVQRSTLLSIWDLARARQPSLRHPAIGVSDGVLCASWSFVDIPGRVFTMAIQRNGTIDWFYRDSVTYTSCGSEDELLRELPTEALELLAAGFSPTTQEFTQ